MLGLSCVLGKAAVLIWQGLRSLLRLDWGRVWELSEWLAALSPGGLPCGSLAVAASVTPAGDVPNKAGTPYTNIIIQEALLPLLCPCVRLLTWESQDPFELEGADCTGPACNGIVGTAKPGLLGSSVPCTCFSA